MAKASSGKATKVSFGSRKGGKAKKSHNKHDSKSSYHKRNASR